MPSPSAYDTGGEGALEVWPWIIDDSYRIALSVNVVVN